MVPSKASVRLVYERSNDMEETLFIEDLNYDGQKFIHCFVNDGELMTKEYRYLMKYEGQTSRPSMRYRNYLIYALVNDDSLTWEEIESSSLQSLYPKQIVCAVIYMTLY